MSCAFQTQTCKDCKSETNFKNVKGCVSCKNLYCKQCFDSHVYYRTFKCGYCKKFSLDCQSTTATCLICYKTLCSLCKYNNSCKNINCNICRSYGNKNAACTDCFEDTSKHPMEKCPDCEFTFCVTNNDKMNQQCIGCKQKFRLPFHCRLYTGCLRCPTYENQLCHNCALLPEKINPNYVECGCGKAFYCSAHDNAVFQKLFLGGQCVHCQKLKKQLQKPILYGPGSTTIIITEQCISADVLPVSILKIILSYAFSATKEIKINLESARIKREERKLKAESKLLASTPKISKTAKVVMVPYASINNYSSNLAASNCAFINMNSGAVTLLSS